MSDLDNKVKRVQTEMSTTLNEFHSRFDRHSLLELNGKEISDDETQLSGSTAIKPFKGKMASVGTEMEEKSESVRMQEQLNEFESYV